MSNPFQPKEATVPQSVVDMQNIAQYNWQQKAKCAVTALAAAIGDLEDGSKVWEGVERRMRHMGYDEPNEVIASLIR